jgi:hypothetical protein
MRARRWKTTRIGRFFQLDHLQSSLWRSIVVYAIPTFSPIQLPSCRHAYSAKAAHIETRLIIVPCFGVYGSTSLRCLPFQSQNSDCS